MGQILAIDQSTSATKALLFDAHGRLLDKVSIEHRQIYPQPGWVEHNAEEIWRNTIAAFKTLVEKARINDPICVSITNQRETIVVFERGTGKPLHNAIVWQCHRGDLICAELVKAGHDPLVRRRTGLKIDTYFSASKLTWLMRNRPDIAAKVKAGDALIGTIDTYLMYRLTNGRVFATDHTNASRTLLFDIHRLRWDEELCELFAIPMQSLAEVWDSTTTYGQTDLGEILPKRIPICGVMGDSQASLFAHRCFKPGTAKVTVGTGSSVLLNLGAEARDGGDGALTTIAWTHEGKATYSFEGIINYSAATIAWLKDQLGLIQNAAETEAAATKIDDNGGVYLVPAFAGLSAPYWSPTSRAAIVGLSAHSDRNHVIRAALESIAYQLRDVLEMMRDRAGVKLDAIHADGGATRNKFLMHFIADMSGMEVRASQVAECSALGAAMAGMVACGVCSIDSLEKLPREQVVYRPGMARERVDAFYAGWKRAVKQVLAGVEK